ncbi:MAG: LLM class flavin-dependent oxidoreductase [Acidobacteria bacterium]|nr:LLM class flavin-dependent oxidoreductase [Acidobacteriota bacterium]
MSARTQFGYLIPTREAVMRAADGRADVGRMLELAVRAEQKGFDSVWVGDSILARPRFEALTTLAAIAALTRRVQLGTAVYLTPLRHPVPLAHTVGNLDLLSGGRLLFGIGLGPPTPTVRAEYAACGVDFHQRGKLQEEGLQIMKGLWKGQPFTFQGKLFGVNNATLHPLPARAGGPPVLLAAVAERPLRRLARLGDGWLPIGPNPQAFAAGWKRIQEYCAEGGRDPATLRRVLYVTLNVNRDAAGAANEMEEFLEAYYGAGHERIAREQAIRAGEPERCAEFLRAFVEVGVSHFVVRFASRDQERQMDSFVSDLIPLLPATQSEPRP